jgi:hypothetical protein|nr:MAG TPA: hypothetical protein [Caudoviricetes sp.]
MTQETFNLLNHLSSEGMDSGCYGFVQDENTKEYFGTEENVNLEGMYLYIYQRKDDWFSHIKEKPEYTFDLDGKDNLFLFKLE